MKKAPAMGAFCYWINADETMPVVDSLTGAAPLSATTLICIVAAVFGGIEPTDVCILNVCLVFGPVDAIDFSMIADPFKRTINLIVVP